MNNAERDRKLYRYPDSDLLRNVPDIRDSETLELFERTASHQRIEEGAPTGNFDLAHLQAIHRHLFQDVYEWAGEVRRVDISKGGRWFHPHDRIETGMADVHRRLVSGKFLTGLGRKDFAQEAGAIIGDVNLVHPFREGNGRTQFQYLKQLARISQSNGCIGPKNLTKFFYHKELPGSGEGSDANTLYL